ncbi:MAG: MFS transporter [Clostridium sp.]|jgi:oligogalacturonide transporter|uniref:MFS transporter n=1 Tax=Clostridium sp. TaxID=1506 RepID=UPI0025C57B00|nr:MFS transporter [Clostridium sp.]MCH3965923.1 MFS transporter [Clostridium sp.]MCI1715988.1 MFS transporter [Clostridium sp.]MCI1800340.1 MFS transporter [Clostridium sp.]MCI1814165.1 MFS transporter [Clostridium sp.]MCI1871064.1 MFS transporter [Clostridium sp.]
MSRRDKKVTIPVGIGYGLVDLMGGGAFTIIGTFLLFFYTTFAGLSPVQGASIIAIARIVDAVASLLMGSITDNFYKSKLGKKFGRRRFFLLIGAPLMADYILLWITGMNYWFYLGTYIMFEIIASMVLIPWETLPAEMTKDFNDRTKISTSRMFISATGTFLATFVPGQLIRYFGQTNAYAYFINGLIFAILYGICIFIAYKVTWEREITPAMKKEMLQTSNENKGFIYLIKTIVKVSGDYISTLKIKSFRKHLIIYLLSFTAKDTFNAVFVYFCVYDLKVSASLAANLLSLSIVGIPMTILGGFLMIKIGPANLYKMSYSTMIICLLAFYEVYVYDAGSKTLILFLIAAVYQMGRSLLEFTPWNVFPFIPDVDEMVTRQRREGLFAAVMTFTRKSSVAIATFVVGVILQSSGFVKGNTVQPPQVMHTIAYILVIGCTVMLLLSIVMAFTFKLNKQTHLILVKEIDRLKNNGSKTDVEPKTREVVENLTGYKYEDVWK